MSSNPVVVALGGNALIRRGERAEAATQHGGTALGAVGGGMAIALFSYLGVETAAVAAAKVRDPSRNVPRATIRGTLATAVVYVLALVAVFGILPASQLADANAPFSSAVDAIFGGTLWGNVIAAVVVVSGFGALNG